MKKIIIFVAAVLFGISATFAQSWTLNFEWEASECDDCQDGYFVVVYTLYDNANDEEIYTNVESPHINLTTDHWGFLATEVESNCHLLSETYIPSYSIHATVKLYCKDNSLTYEVICSGTDSDSGITCLDFYDGGYFISGIVLQPVN